MSSSDKFRPIYLVKLIEPKSGGSWEWRYEVERVGSRRVRWKAEDAALKVKLREVTID